jgi:hypothetical protein
VSLLSSRNEPWLLSYLFNAAWQIPLVFVAAWVAARILRRADLRAEHRIWVSALLLDVALPAFDFRVAGIWDWLRAVLSSWSSGAVEQGQIRVVFGSAAVSRHSLHLPPALLTGIAFAWMTWLLYFAARLAWGVWQTHILARAAIRFTLSSDAALRWKRCCDSFHFIACAPELAVSPHGVGPVTVGIRRGLLLLPPGFREDIAAADLDAVLAHEFAHIKRHDFAKNLLYNIVRYGRRTNPGTAGPICSTGSRSRLRPPSTLLITRLSVRIAPGSHCSHSPSPFLNSQQEQPMRALHVRLRYQHGNRIVGEELRKRRVSFEA